MQHKIRFPVGCHSPRNGTGIWTKIRSRAQQQQQQRARRNRSRIGIPPGSDFYLLSPEIQSRDILRQGRLMTKWVLNVYLDRLNVALNLKF